MGERNVRMSNLIITPCYWGTMGMTDPTPKVIVDVRYGQVNPRTSERIPLQIPILRTVIALGVEGPLLSAENYLEWFQRFK